MLEFNTSIAQPAHLVSEVLLGALSGDCHMSPARQRFQAHEQVETAFALIGLQFHDVLWLALVDFPFAELYQL